MPFRVRVHDVVIEVDTETELRSVLGMLGVKEAQAQAPLPRANVGEQIVEPQSQTRLVRQLCDRVADKSQQRLLLRMLADAPDGISDEQLRARLAVENNNALAGIIAGVAKNSRAVGLPSVIIRNRRPDRTTLYSLEPFAREIVQQRIHMNGRHP